MVTYFFIHSFSYAKDLMIRQSNINYSATLDCHCIVCLNPKAQQHSKYFLVFHQILFVSLIMFLLFSVYNFQICQYSDPLVCSILCLIYFVLLNSDNLSENLNWSRGLYVIPTTLGVFRQTSEGTQRIQLVNTTYKFLSLSIN